MGLEVLGKRCGARNEVTSGTAPFLVQLFPEKKVLEEYRKKRYFRKTPEPEGREKNDSLTGRSRREQEPSGKEGEISERFCKEIEKKLKGKIPTTGRPLYMVHDHYSRSHHHDLRLEFGGVLRSWAIPKLIEPKDLFAKKLAVQTENHPLEYGYWEGEIPQGSYGAGKSLIWDSGTFEVLEEQEGKKLVFRVEGKKLKGTFVLIHFRPRERGWLFFRKKEG